MGKHLLCVCSGAALLTGYGQGITDPYLGHTIGPITSYGVRDNKSAKHHV